MPTVFISYRRSDSKKDAARIYDRLVQAFGRQNVFKDIDSIPLGTDFRGVLHEALAKCDFQLVIIGRSWLNSADADGSRRLDDYNDFVRAEIETALQRDSCKVIPVLVDGAEMPSPEALPITLRELAFQNAATARDDPDFHSDINKIIEQINQSKSNIRTPVHNTPRETFGQAAPTPTIARSGLHIPRVYIIGSLIGGVAFSLLVANQPSGQTLALLAFLPGFIWTWASIAIFRKTLGYSSARSYWPLVGCIAAFILAMLLHPPNGNLLENVIVWVTFIPVGGLIMWLIFWIGQKLNITT